MAVIQMNQQSSDTAAVASKAASVFSKNGTKQTEQIMKGATVFDKYAVSVVRDGTMVKIAGKSDMEKAQADRNVKKITYTDRETGATFALPAASTFVTKQEIKGKLAVPASVTGAKELKLIGDIQTMVARTQGITAEIQIIDSLTSTTTGYSTQGADSQFVFSKGTFCAPGGEGGNLSIGNAYWFSQGGKVNELGINSMQIQGVISNSYVSIQNYDGKAELTQYTWDQCAAIAKTLGAGDMGQMGALWAKPGTNGMVDYVAIAFNMASSSGSDSTSTQAGQSMLVLIPKELAKEGVDCQGNPLTYSVTFTTAKYGNAGEMIGLYLGAYDAKYDQYGGWPYLDQVKTPFNMAFKGGMTGVAGNTVLPAKFKLQNYPNPFNPTTVLRFETPKAGRVSVKVFDTAGKVVATLANEVVSAGTHEVDFNAKNLSSGTYYGAVFLNGQYQGVTKMVLVK